MPKSTAILVHHNNTWTLKLIGNIDSATLRLNSAVNYNVSLLEQIAQSGGKKLFIDLIATESIDADGFKVLLNTQKEFAEKGIQIVLKNPTPPMKQLLKIMRCDRLFVIEC